MFPAVLQVARRDPKGHWSLEIVDRMPFSSGLSFMVNPRIAVAADGVVVLAPLYLVPPPPVGAENFYGFVGCALVFQWLFWIVGGDPARYRALMLPAVAEKLVFAVPALALFAMDRLMPLIAGFAVVDILLGIGFLVAWRRTA